jgi:hypothetical protein
MNDFSKIDDTQTMWSTPDEKQVLLDADCSPSRTCRNMVNISFDGLAEAGSDLSEAWRSTLERDGKVKEGSGSLHDLVFGPSKS